jgi:acetylornithine deacetylase/succinyl-diaminopimelate desuccinylase-like protein
MIDVDGQPRHAAIPPVGENVMKKILSSIHQNIQKISIGSFSWLTGSATSGMISAFPDSNKPEGKNPPRKRQDTKNIS